MNRFIQIIRYILIFIFAITLFNKLFDYAAFKQQLFLSPLIPPSYMGLIAILTITFESAILIFLIIDKYNMYGFLLSSFLLSLFGFYLLFLVVNFKFNKPCGCGFIFSFLSYSQHIIFNFSFSLLSSLIILLNRKWISPLPQ
jgi:hypothetical protein